LSKLSTKELSKMSQNKFGQIVDNAGSFVDSRLGVENENLDPNLFEGYTSQTSPNDANQNAGKRLSGYEIVENQQKEGNNVSGTSEFLDAGF